MASPMQWINSRMGAKSDACVSQVGDIGGGVVRQTLGGVSL